MPRLFSGIEIPKDLHADLGRLQTGLEGARWIEPHDFHITLRFVGEIDDHIADEFAYFLSAIEFAPLELTLVGMGAFGGKRPNAVWVGISPNPALDHLHHAHEMAAQKAGLKPETRKFMPHLTLARLRGIGPVQTAHYLETKGLVKFPPITVSQTALFSARPSGGGGPYAVEMTYPSTRNPPLNE